jgi:hypothetical protein
MLPKFVEVLFQVVFVVWKNCFIVWRKIQQHFIWESRQVLSRGNHRHGVLIMDMQHALLIKNSQYNTPLVLIIDVSVVMEKNFILDEMCL